MSESKARAKEVTKHLSFWLIGVVTFFIIDYPLIEIFKQDVNLSKELKYVLSVVLGIPPSMILSGFLYSFVREKLENQD